MQRRFPLQNLLAQAPSLDTALKLTRGQVEHGVPAEHHCTCVVLCLQQPGDDLRFPVPHRCRFGVKSECGVSFRKLAMALIA